MNRNLLLWGISIVVFALQATGARGQGYEFAAVSNSVTAGVNFSAVANSANVFVCVGAANSPVLSVDTNNFASFAAGNFGGGFLLASSAWTNTLNSRIKYNSLNCVAAQPNGFIASGASNAVYVSSDGVNWTNWGNVMPAGNETVSADGISYNPVSGTFGAALAIYDASWTTNPISTNVWQASTLQTEAFAESFRGITAFGSSNMAMCGIFGDIRVSPDGGKDWNLSQQVNFNYPNLLSIASDGGSNLVCAGDYSMLEVSTNGGPNASSWIFQTNFNIGTPGSVTNFNAVAYNPTANAFLAAGTVGANGLIVMATNNAASANWKWTGQTNLWTLKNGSLTQNANALVGITLNGAAFANSGFFQGIAMVVGNNGAVFIGGLPPPAPTNSAGNYVTNVLTNPQGNLALGDVGNIVTDSNHPANVLAIDWYTAATGGIQLETNSPLFQPPGTLYNKCGAYTNWAAERDLRTGFTSTNRTPFVFYIVPGPPEDPVSATNCDANGQFGMCAMTPLSVTVVTNAANPPGTMRVNWYDENLNLVASNTYSSDSDIVTFTPTNLPPGIYTFYAQATNPATGLASANWTIVTNQLNALPEWTNSVALSTNVTLANPATFLAPSITNLVEITDIEPGASVTYDWYTSPDPTVSTFENPAAPLVATGPTFTPSNLVCGVYNYYVRARVVDPNFTACACQSISLIPATYTLLPAAPINPSVGLINVLTGAVQTNAPIWVDVLTNAANPATNFVVNWYSTATGSNSANFLNNSSDTNFNNRFFYTPTNAACGVFTIWAETMAVNGGGVSPSRIPVVFTIIPAAPTVVGTADVTNCIEVPNPTFTVAVANGQQTANWYSVGGAGGAKPPLASALSYTPTTTSVGAWTFSVLAFDPISGLSSTGAATVTLTLYDCSSSPAISMDAASGTGTIQWPGNLTLLSTTNLTPPVVWTSVATGSNFLAPNTVTFTNTIPPVQFFRLTN